MKILIINSVCGIRSTGRICTDMAERFINEGHICRIAYGREKVPEQYEAIAYRIGNELQLKWNALKARFLDNEGLNAVSQTKKFLEWATEYNPDILWLHNLHGYYINYEMLFRWIKNRPQMEVRWTLHDCWSFTGHCAHFSYVNCQQWKTECLHCIQKNEYPRSIVFSNCKKNYARKTQAFCGVNNMTIITPSQWLAELVRKSFLKDYPIEIIHNRIDEEIFRPTHGDFRKKHGLQNKNIVLGVSTAWGERKGLFDYVELADMLGESYVIVLVGLDESNRKKLPESIVYVPRTNCARELAEIYTTANVFVNLTYEDTYPTVNLEAQACGTPCLTYRTGGSVESVFAENVVEQGDLVAMAAKIKSICD